MHSAPVEVAIPPGWAPARGQGPLGPAPLAQPCLQPPLGLQPPLSEDQRWRQQKRLEKATRAERRRLAEEEGNAYTVKCLCWLSVLNIVLLLVPMLGGNWCHRHFVGFGVKSLTIRASLFMIEVDLRCGKNPIEDMVCEPGLKMNGLNTLPNAQAAACAISVPACHVMERIYWASFIVFLSYSLAAACLLGGALLLHFYWHRRPLVKVRQLAQACFCLAPLCGAGGLSAWTLCVPDLEELPRSWNHLTGGLPHGVLDLRAGPGFPYGWCWLFSLLTAASLLVQAALWPCLFQPHQGEEAAELQERDRQEALACGAAAWEERRPLLGHGAPQAYGPLT